MLSDTPHKQWWFGNPAGDFLFVVIEQPYYIFVWSTIIFDDNSDCRQNARSVNPASGNGSESGLVSKEAREQLVWVAKHSPSPFKNILFAGALHQALLDPWDLVDVLNNPLHPPLKPPRGALPLLQQPWGLLQGDRQPQPAPRLLHVCHLCLQGECQEQGQSQVWLGEGGAQRICENFARNHRNDRNGCWLKTMLCHALIEGSLPVPKWMNSWKSFKGGGGVISKPTSS